MRPGAQVGGAFTPLSRRRRWLHLGVAALGGAMQCLGYAGFGWWPFAFICFLPMFFLVEAEAGATPRRIFALGLVHGCVGYAGGYYWMIPMIEVFAELPIWIAWLLGAAFIAWHGLQQMLVYGLYQFARTRGVAITLAGVLSLLTMELLHPVIFPSYLATGLHELTAFIQTADLGGAMLISAVVMGVNGTLFELGRAALRSEPLPRLAPALALGAVLLTFGYGLWRIEEVEARVDAARTISVGVVQVNLGIFEKREDPLESLRRHQEQSSRIEAGEELDLLLWSETASSYPLEDGIQAVPGWVRGSVRSPLLFGGIRRREDSGGAQEFNSAYLTGSSGEILGSYDKVHLLPFGEFLPFGEAFPALYDWSPGSQHLTPGGGPSPLVLPHAEGDVRLTVLICYEDVLPGFTRRAVREGDPHLLVNLTNDAWFGDTHEPWIHLALAKFRAVEHRRSLVRATNSGVSTFVDPVGRVTGSIGVFERGEMMEEVPLLEGTTLYARLGDWPGYLALIGIVSVSLRSRRGGLRERES